MRRSQAIVVIVLCIFAVCVAALGSSLASADEPPPQNSNTLIRNLSGEQASVLVEFYNPDGSVEWSTSFTLPAYGAKTIGTVEYGPYLPASWRGSQVVSSDKPVVATVVNYGSPSAHNIYEGFSGGSTSLLMPSIHWNAAGQISTIAVQNVYTSDANVEITYYNREGTALTDPPITATIKPGAAEFRDALTDCAACGDPPVGSVRVTSDKDIAGVVLESVWGDKTYSYGAFTPADADTTIRLPSVHRNPAGQYSWILVQNQSDTNSTQVTITYYDREGNPVDVFTRTLAAKGSYTFATDPASPEEPTNLGNVGNAVITSSAEPIVAVVLEAVLPLPYMYSGFNSTAGSTSVLLPSVHRNPGGQFSWILVQNTNNTTSTDVTIHYYDQSGTEVDSFTKTLAANGSYTFATDPASPEEPTNLGNVGSALVESTATDIVVVVVEGVGGVFGCYAGFAQ